MKPQLQRPLDAPVQHDDGHTKGPGGKGYACPEHFPSESYVRQRCSRMYALDQSPPGGGSMQEIMTHTVVLP